MNSTYFKNFTATASMVLLSFFILGIAFFFIGRSFIIRESRAGISESAVEVARVAAAFSQIDGLESWELRMSLSSISRSTGDLIFIADPAGVVISCSDMEIVCPHIGRHIGGNVLNALKTDRELHTITDLGGVYSAAHYVTALPVRAPGGGDAGYVFVASNYSDISSGWHSFLQLFVIIAAATILLALFMSYFTSKYTSRPLVEMAAAARRFGHGDYSVRVESTGRNDEVGELTDAFNAMAGSIEKSEELRREFIANVSHELKTPMTSIAGFADGILDGTIPPENQEKYLAVISAETKRLSRLVSRMLSLSRVQSGETPELRLGEFDISEVLCRSLLSFEDKITAKSLDVDARLPEEGIIVMGEEDSIMQVAYNLLENAIKFAKPSSTLGITLWKQGRAAFVSIKNEGETIPKEELPLLFDRFHKTDRSRSHDREGLGLGLYIVKSILNRHKEDISVTSRNGVTEFIFTLTLSDR